MKPYSQHWKILTFMSKRKWCVSEDFMQYDLGQLFVGYEACARLSELYKFGYVTAKYRTEVFSLFKPKTEGQRRSKAYCITKKGLTYIKNINTYLLI